MIYADILALSKYRGGAFPLWQWSSECGGAGGSGDSLSNTSTPTPSDTESMSSVADDGGYVEEELDCIEVQG